MIFNLLNKKRARITNNLLIMVGIVLIGLLISLSVIAQGEESDESLRAELDNLTSYLDEQGYDWLVNYSLIKFIKYDNLMLSIDNKILSG